MENPCAGSIPPCKIPAIEPKVGRLLINKGFLFILPKNTYLTKKKAVFETAFRLKNGTYGGIHRVHKASDALRCHARRASAVPDLLNAVEIERYADDLLGLYQHNHVVNPNMHAALLVQ